MTSPHLPANGDSLHVAKAEGKKSCPWYPVGSLVHFWPMARRGAGYLGVIDGQPYPMGGTTVVRVLDIDGERARPMALSHIEVIHDA